MCDEGWVEDLEIVKKKTMHFFKDIFKEEFVSDVHLENLPFCTLDNVESSWLERKFSKEEITTAFKDYMMVRRPWTR